MSSTGHPNCRRTAESQDVFNGYRNAFAASAAIASKNLVEAEKLARQSLNKTVENHPGIREVMYDLRMAQNQQQNARRNFELVGNWAHASPDFFEKKVDFEMQQKNFQNALDYIELAESTFGNRSLFIVKKSIALANLQQINQAIATLKECRTYPSTKETCETLLAQIDKT